MQEDELNIEIWRLLQSGHLSKASALIDTGLRNTPDSWLLMEKKGLLHLQLKNYREAIDIFKILIERDPRNTNSYLNICLALSNQTRFAEAIDILESQLPFDENNIHINLMLADSYKNLGKMRLARRHYACYARHAAHYRPPSDARTSGNDATELLNTLIDLLCIEPVAVDIASAVHTEKILESAQKTLYLVNSLTERDKNQLRPIIKVLVERISNFYVPYYITNCRPFFEAYSRFLSWIYYDEIKSTTTLQNVVTRATPRIALISENFGLHSTWWIYYMFEDLLKVTPVDVTIFSINQQADSEQLKQYLKFGKVQHVSLSPADVPSFSQTIAKLGFHAVVLPDVGMSSISRNLSVFPLAPRQIVFWTHPITTGSKACTDFLTNSLMDCAQDMRDHYTEQPVIMKGIGIHFSLPKAITCIRQLKTRKKRLCSIQTLPKYHPSFGNPPLFRGDRK